MSDNLSPDVIKRISRLEQLVSQLKAEDKKLRKSIASGGSGGSTGDFANGIGPLISDPTKVGFVTSDMIESAIINLNGNDLTFGLETDSEFGIYGDPLGISALFFVPNDFFLQMQHPLIDDAGYTYLDLGFNSGSGEPFFDLYVEGGPGSQNYVEIYAEPGLLGIYRGANAIFEIDTVEEADAPHIMALNSNFEVVRRTVASLGGTEVLVASDNSTSENTGALDDSMVTSTFFVVPTVADNYYLIEMEWYSIIQDSGGGARFALLGAGATFAFLRILWTWREPGTSTIEHFTHDVSNPMTTWITPTTVLNDANKQALCRMQIYTQAANANGTLKLTFSHHSRVSGFLNMSQKWWRRTKMN